MSKTSNINRVDGFAKVTGTATYSAEYKTPGVVYACLVGSTIAKGRIKKYPHKIPQANRIHIKLMSHTELFLSLG